MIKDIKITLWATADKRRANIGAAEDNLKMRFAGSRRVSTH
jgi:hypothetical protein